MSASSSPNPDTLPTAGVMRRFGAMFYDLLLLAALLMVITALLLPLTGGEAITYERYGALEYVYQLLLLVVVIGFFGLFWTHRGQTLGMMAWRLKLVRIDGRPLSWIDTLKRLIAAVVSWLPAGLGYFWIWIDRDHLAWHDRWSNTLVIVTPKRL